MEMQLKRVCAYVGAFSCVHVNPLKGTLSMGANESQSAQHYSFYPLFILWDVYEGGGKWGLPCLTVSYYWRL